MFIEKIINTKGVYLTYSNHINFPKCGIGLGKAFKPTHLRRKWSLIPPNNVWVELSRFRSRRLQTVYQNIYNLPYLMLENERLK